jgi:transcriptional regulator with XRE-family HTH domain
LEQEFTILENKIVGRNLYKFRKVSDVKASDVADYIGISEAAYTKYERGESKITIDIIQKVAQYLKVDPLNIIAAPPGTFFESGNNSPGAIVGNNNVQTMSDEQTRLLTKLIETQIAMNEKILVLLEKK